MSIRSASLLLTILLTVISGEEEQQPTVAIGHPFSWGFMQWEEMTPYGGNTKGTETTLVSTPSPRYTAIYEKGISKKEQDRRAILALVGDYRVTFDFIETAGVAENYTPQRPYFSWATERVFLLSDLPDQISLQHILVMEFIDEEGEVQGPFTMKHWRQDWRYEDNTHVRYRGDRQWSKETAPPTAGSWTQEVFQVDDSPRYEAVGQWTHQGGLSTFSTRPFWRPLPRREFSVRDDYNVLSGKHDITLNPTGWVHLQNNRKEVAQNGAITRTLATEIGAVRYERISEPNLDAANDYWEKTGPYWQAVREKWAQVFAENDQFSIRQKVDDQALFMHHFSHAGELESADAPDYEAYRTKARETIEAFLVK